MLDQIERYNEQYKAHNPVDAERALEHTWDSEQRWSYGRPLGGLDRVPVAIKDLILARGWPTLRGSRAIEVNHRWFMSRGFRWQSMAVTRLLNTPTAKARGILPWSRRTR
jgi:hypothetical protein